MSYVIFWEWFGSNTLNIIPYIRVLLYIEKCPCPIQKKKTIESLNKSKMIPLIIFYHCFYFFNLLNKLQASPI